MPQQTLVRDELLEASTRVLARAFGALVRGNSCDGSHGLIRNVQDHLVMYRGATTKEEKIASLESAATQIMLLIAHEQESDN